jgi:hypothetical protein
MDGQTVTLKAVAEDNAGNTEESTLSVRIENLPSQGLDAKAAIDAAKGEKDEAEALVDYLNAQGIAVPESMAALKDEADAKMLDAKSDFDNEQWSTAESQAEEAEAKYRELNEKYSAESFDSAAYSFETEEVAGLYQSIGLDEGLQEEAVANAEENGLTRALNLIEVKAGEESSFGASITLTFTNNSGETKSLKLIEVIPKNFAAKASDLSSDYAFTVIEEDPVIEFDLGSVSPGEIVEITYGLKSTVNRFTADAMINNKVIESFQAPPIVLGSETVFEKGMVSPGTAFFTMPAFDMGAIAMGVIAVFIIALVVIVGGGFLFYKGNGGGSNADKRKKFEWVDPETNKGWSFKKEKDGW